MFALGFDVGGTNARVGLFEFNDSLDRYTLLSQESERLRGDTSLEAVSERVSSLGQRIVGRHSLHIDDMVAIGVGLAAQLQGSRVLNAPNLGWRDVEVGEGLSRGLGGKRVMLVNDLNALVWGEVVHGTTKGASEILAVYVGTGVGGAIVTQSKLLLGAGGIAGEIGHMKVVPGGKLCGCGERGCVEAYAGGIHLEREVSQLHDKDAFPKAWEVVTTEGQVNLTMADAHVMEHEALEELWQGVSEKLAICIANACTLLNPACLLLGGGVWENCPTFRSKTLQKISELTLQGAKQSLQVAEPSIPAYAGMLGSAHLALKRERGER